MKSRRQIVFDWLMGGEEGYWGGSEEVARVDALLTALDAFQAMPPEASAIKMLRRAHVEMRRWKSCQNIGACRNCADDGFLLQLGLFLELHKDEGSPL